MRAWLLLALLVAAPLAGCVESGNGPPAAGSEGSGGGGGGEVGQQAQGPAWSMVDTHGATHSHETTDGEPKLLFFMATWCASCRALTGKLADLNATYAPHGLQLFSITFDPNEDEDDLEGWKDRYDQHWPHGIDDSFETHRNLGIRSQSSVAVLSGDGQLVAKWGYPGPSKADMEQAIETAFDQGAEDA